MLKIKVAGDEDVGGWCKSMYLPKDLVELCLWLARIKHKLNLDQTQIKLTLT